jgi:hypothetical protein
MPALAGPLLVACAILVAAGISKVTSPDAATRTLSELGLPSSGPLVRSIGVAETVLGLATAGYGGVLAAGVGVAYSAFALIVVAALRSDSVTTCGCFGSSSPRPRNIHVLANVTLAGAAFAATGIDAPPRALADGPPVASMILTVAAIGLAALLFVSRAANRAKQSPAASNVPRPAYDISGDDPEGSAVEVQVLDATSRTVVAFLSTTCVTCRHFWETLPGVRLGDRTRLVVVTQGPEIERAERVWALASAPLYVVMSTTTWDDYGVTVAPTFVLVDGPSGQCVAEVSAETWGQVRAGLLRTPAP